MPYNPPPTNKASINIPPIALIILPVFFFGGLISSGFSSFTSGISGFGSSVGGVGGGGGGVGGIGGGGVDGFGGGGGLDGAGGEVGVEFVPAAAKALLKSPAGFTEGGAGVAEGVGVETGVEVTGFSRSSGSLFNASSILL